MSASKSDAAESSRARQKPDPEPSDEEVLPSWVVLASTPDIIPNGDPMVHMIPPGRDVLLPSPLHEPPCPCVLSLYPHIAPDTEYTAARAYIHAAHRSGRILLRVVQGTRGGLFLCNAHNRTAPRLPSVPTEGFGVGLDILPGRSIGLIPDPLIPGHYMIAQLQPRGHQTALPGNDLLLFYMTFSRKWFAKPLGSAPGRVPIPAGDHGVLTHAGMLWWVSLTHGLFFCDPFPILARLRFVEFPGGHEQQQPVVDLTTRIDQRRGVRLSEGRLRFVDILGLATDPTGDNPFFVWMFTLDHPKPGTPWTWAFDNMVPFSEICSHQSYIDAGLPQPQNLMPHFAFLHPENHQVVYFFLDSWIFGVDLSDRHVVDYHQCSIDDGRVRDLRFESSRPIVDAWELLPPTPGDDPSSPDDDASRRWCDVDPEKDRQAIERVTSWLSETVLTNQEDEGQSSSAGEPGSTI